MRIKNFAKANIALSAMFLILITVMAVITACSPSVTPLTPGIATPTGTPTKTASATNTPPLSSTPTNTYTATLSATFTNTMVNTATNTLTSTFTNTLTATPSNTITNTPVNSYTFTSTATNTFTNTPTATATLTATNTASNTPGGNTATFTNTPSSTATATFTNTLTNTVTATLTNTPTAGLIAITSWGRNGNNQFSFVAPNGLASGVTVYFTNLSWNSTAGQFSDQSVISTGAGIAGQGPVTEIEEIIYYYNTGGLAANTQVVIGVTSGVTVTNNLQGGTIGAVAYFGNTSPSGTSLTTTTPSANFTSSPYIDSGKSNAGHLFAYIVPTGTTPSSSNNYFPTGSTFQTGLIFGPDTFTSGAPANYYDSALPSNLTNGTNAVDLSALYNNVATVVPTPYAGVITGGNNILPFLGCTSGPYTGSNWFGTVLGKTHFTLNPQGDGNSGVTTCGSGVGYGLTTPTVTPVPY